MKLEFSLLIVDDDADSIEQAINILRDYLETKGFTLAVQYEKEFSEQHLHDLALSEGRNYDLVVIDYNLGRDDTDGAEVAYRLRRDLAYTDMVFYSSDTAAQLLVKLANNEVEGVFVATRDELDTALTGLANTVIGKAVDLNHMRGIAMAEVAEMDVLMQETLSRFFQSSNEQVVAAGKRTIKSLRRGNERSQKQLEKSYREGGLPSLVSDGRLFSFTDKYWAIGRAVKCLPEEPSEAVSVLASYEDEIINKRNMLAHVKEESAEDGKTILRSIKSDVTIDDDWMTIFRQNLRRHRGALTSVCEAIDNHFGVAEAPDDSEESQP